MKVLNVIWGFTLGAGIDKCFTTYARLGDVDPDVEVKSVCINLLNLNSHIEPLKELGVMFIDIKGRRDFSWLGKLKAHIDREKPDILFTHGFNGAIMMLLERWLKNVKVPVICTYHGPYHAPSASRKILEPLYNGMSLYIYKHLAKRVICVENMSRKFLCKKGVNEEKVVTVHNGIKNIDVSRSVDFSEYLDTPVTTILTASRITEVKGLPYLLEALKILKDRGIIFHYFMIGEGPDLESLKHKAIDLGLTNQITFTGFQNNIPEWLSACDIFALPSLYEYHSIAILEAMRAGKAIVATTVGGNGESINNGIEGILVPSADSTAFADGLEKLFKDSELRKKYGANARKRFEDEFTEEAMMKNLVAVLKS